MKSLAGVAFALATVFSSAALAQDEGTPPQADPLGLGGDGPRGILGLELPETQEREQTLLLQNFLAIDLNSDLLLAESEWDVWSGWHDLPPPDFAGVDGNDSSYLSYREYEDAALSGQDARLGYAMHGAVFPDVEDAAE